MAKHLIYFRGTDGDHLVYVEVADERRDDAAPDMDAAEFQPTIGLGAVNIVGRPRPQDGSCRIS